MSEEKQVEFDKDEDQLTEDEDITVESSFAAGDALSQALSHASKIESVGAPIEDAIASDQLSNLPSQAPTEQLAQEYKKLMDEYDTIVTGNKKLEEQVDNLKKVWT